MPCAKVEQYHGSPAIMVNGKPIPPMSVTIADWARVEPDTLRAYYRDLREAGIRMFYLTTDTRWNQPGDPEKGVPDGITRTMEKMKLLIEAVPDAYIMLRLNVSPPAEWVNAHPEELLTYSDGKPRQVICTSVGSSILDGMHSLCSEAWRRDGDAALREYFDELETLPQFSHVIGFFLCAGGTSEWYYPQGLVNEDGTYGDFSEPFRRSFSAFLKKKYGTEEELRRVWKKPDASFEKPLIPTPAEKTYVTRADAEIVEGLQNWEYAGRVIGMKLNMDARDEANVGVFLNANRFAHTADFFDAWNEGTADTIIHFGHTLKNRFPELLVGAFYGSYGCTDYFEGSTTSGTPKIMDSGVVDFLAAPGVYNNREPGGIVAQREMQDSFRLRNQIYICEDDARTHYAKPWIQRDSMALYTVEDSINTLKRDFARDICEDIHGWWFDMGGNWYNDPDILRLFRRQEEVADFAYSLDRTKHNEIALIYDTESVHYVSMNTSQTVLDFWRTSDLGRIGAPVDYYFHNDMARPDMPDYKLYVMLNQYYLTDAEREAIFAKARKNHAVVLWLYAPGFINPNAETVMCEENISKTVGMTVKMLDRTVFPHFRVAPASHPALSFASASRRYGVIDRDVHSNIWVSPTVLHPAFANPGFYADDEAAVVLGRYCSDGLTAMAMTERDGFRSIFCGAQTLRNDLLASIAAYAGCHLFLRGDDVLYANESFVTVHASEDGVKRLYFKKPCSPFEVYEKRFYGENVTFLDVEMRLGETKMFSLAGEC